MYAITSVLKTNKIVVAAQGEAGTSVQLDVPVIQQAVGGNVKVGTRRSDGVQRHVRRHRSRFRSRFRPCSSCSTTSGEFLTTEQLPAGDAAARALGRETTGATSRVFLGANGAFVRMVD